MIFGILCLFVFGWFVYVFVMLSLLILVDFVVVLYVAIVLFYVFESSFFGRDG